MQYKQQGKQLNLYTMNAKYYKYTEKELRQGLQMSFPFENENHLNLFYRRMATEKGYWIDDTKKYSCVNNINDVIWLTPNLSTTKFAKDCEDVYCKEFSSYYNNIINC